MKGIVGVCGFYKSGSSAVCDLLREFEDAQVLGDTEFRIIRDPSGLMDLGYYLSNRYQFEPNFIAIRRFRELMECVIYPKLEQATNGKIRDLTEEFLQNIVQVQWTGLSLEKQFTQLTPTQISRCKFYQRIIKNLIRRKMPYKWLYNIHMRLFLQNFEAAMFVDDYEKHARAYICNILNEMGRDLDKTTILDQVFDACCPIVSFKFFDSPKAIIVNRDPRDQYLYWKTVLFPKMGAILKMPIDNVDNFIKYYRITRKGLKDLENHDDVLTIDYESLFYDYENSVDKLSDFVGLKHHTRKGTFFNPSDFNKHTRLFNSFPEFNDDIEKIKSELPEFLFPFESFPDIA